MKSVYLETSALLTWLLGETRAEEVRSAVDAVDVVVTSTLAFAETERGILRIERDRLLKPADAQKLRGALQRARNGWMSMAVTEEVLARASRIFPVEPVRTLDAIHLATALAFTKALPDLSVLSYDRRILDNVEALGMTSAI